MVVVPLVVLWLTLALAFASSRGRWSAFFDVLNGLFLAALVPLDRPCDVAVSGFLFLECSAMLTFALAVEGLVGAWVGCPRLMMMMMK